MTVPGLAEWVFSVKTFAAALIALYIALSLGLDRPYWCVATVYIVSQPLAGAMRSKAVYRICGTLLGAIAAVALVPNLADAPVLLVTALGLWLGVCLYFALGDRSPRSYVFLLAGYTAAIIGFPSVDQPGQIFDTAVARVEEIGLGILCATMVGSLVFPRSVAPLLDARMAAYFAVARRWALAALSGGDEAEVRSAPRALARASAEFTILTTHLAYDTSPQHAARKPVAVLDARLIYLLPVISGVASRIAALQRAGGLSPEISGLVHRVAEFLRSGPETPSEIGRQLRKDLSASATAPSKWTAILTTALLARLAEFVDVVDDIRALRRQVLSGDARLPPLALPPGIGPDATRSRDRAMALLSVFAATLTIVVICAFWIATEWPEGGVAAMMAAIMCSFFAALDNPVPPILGFLKDTGASIVVAAVYLFVVLPQVTDFVTLALALAPLYLLGGAFGVVALNSTMMLTLTDTYSADFASYINTSAASACGIVSAAVVTALLRSVGADVTARRLRRACRRDVARAAAHRGAVDRPALAALLLDRLAEVAPRLAGADADVRMETALHDLTTGLSVVDLRGDAAALPSAMRDDIEAVLAGVAAHYEWPIPEPPAPALLARIDRTIAAVAQSGVAPVRHLLIELLAIRQGLFPDASDPGGMAVTAGASA